MLPPAPGRLSMTTCWPSLSPSLGATMRTVASVEPPGGKVTIMRIGLLGQAAGAGVCARLPAATATKAVATPRVRKKRFTEASMRCSGIARRVPCRRSSLRATVTGDLLEQLEQLRSLALAEVAEQLALHAVGDAFGLLDQHRALARQGDRLLAAVFLAARARDQFALDELVADEGQARRRDVERERHLPLRDGRVGGDQHQDREVDAAKLERLADPLVEDLQARDRRLREAVAEQASHLAVIQAAGKGGVTVARGRCAHRGKCRGHAGERGLPRALRSNIVSNVND